MDLQNGYTLMASNWEKPASAACFSRQFRALLKPQPALSFILFLAHQTSAFEQSRHVCMCKCLKKKWNSSPFVRECRRVNRRCSVNASTPHAFFAVASILLRMQSTCVQLVQCRPSVHRCDAAASYSAGVVTSSYSKAKRNPSHLFELPLKLALVPPPPTLPVTYSTTVAKVT